MNDISIEKILLQAPKPSAPPELLKQLQAEIALPSSRRAPQAHEWQNPLRRWFPALAFGVLMLSCAIMIAVQASWSANLKHENEVLRAAAADLPQLRERHTALEQAQANHDELVQLRKDNDELHQLQAEVAQLRNLPAQIEQLQNENKRLAAALTTSATAGGGNFFDDVGRQLAEAKAKAQRIQCVNNLKQVGLAIRVWAGENGERYPTSLVVMSNELSTPKILICPSDTAAQSYASLKFGQFQDNMTSYKFTIQPDDETYPECIVARCPIHHNYLLADGSVQQINPENIHEVNIDGRWYLKPVNDANLQERAAIPIK